MVRCLHQWVRPSGPHVDVHGVGNCKICQPDEKNKECRGYHPIKIITYGVKEEE